MDRRRCRPSLGWRSCFSVLDLRAPSDPEELVVLSGAETVLWGRAVERKLQFPPTTGTRWLLGATAACHSWSWASSCSRRHGVRGDSGGHGRDLPRHRAQPRDRPLHVMSHRLSVYATVCAALVVAVFLAAGATAAAPPAPTISGTPSNPSNDRSPTFRFTAARPIRRRRSECRLDVHVRSLRGQSPDRSRTRASRDGSYTFEYRRSTRTAQAGLHRSAGRSTRRLPRLPRSQRCRQIRPTTGVRRSGSPTARAE